MPSLETKVDAGIRGGLRWRMTVEPLADDDIYTWMELSDGDKFGFGGERFDRTGVMNIWFGRRPSGQKLAFGRVADKVAAVDITAANLNHSPQLSTETYGMRFFTYFAPEDITHATIKVFDDHGRTLGERAVVWAA